MREIARIGVVGSGQMGAGFAELCARSGCDVRVVCSGQDGLARGKARLESALDRLESRGKIDATERRHISARVSLTTCLSDLTDRDLVLESIPEIYADKRDLFERLDLVLKGTETIVATNTSSIPVMRLATAMEDRCRVLGLHFFNPVQVMPLVEVVSTLHTTGDVVQLAREFCVDVLGKTVIEVKDRPGFLVNSLLLPYLMSAARAVEAAVGTAEDIDKAMKGGCGHPMGPLELIDLIGVDVVHAVGSSMYRETRETHHAPPSILTRMLEGGCLGQKSGQGFYSYERTAKVSRAI